MSDGDAQLCGLLGLAVLLWFPTFAGRESINGFPLAFPLVTGPRLPVRKVTGLPVTHKGLDFLSGTWEVIPGGGWCLTDLVCGEFR